MLLFGILVCIILRIRIKESGRKEGPVIGGNKGASYVIENVGYIALLRWRGSAFFGVRFLRKNSNMHFFNIDSYTRACFIRM